MRIQIAGEPVEFSFDDLRECYVAPFSLTSWSEFRSENSRPDLRGDRVLLLLPSNADKHSPHLIASAIDRFIAHQEQLRDAAAAAIVGFIEELRNDLVIRDDELDAFEGAHQLRTMIDPSFVRFFPGSARVSIEFECNWDPEHGCGVMFEDMDVIEVGGSDSAHGTD